MRYYILSIQNHIVKLTRGLYSHRWAKGLYTYYCYSEAYHEWELPLLVHGEVPIECWTDETMVLFS